MKSTAISRCVLTTCVAVLGGILLLASATWATKTFQPTFNPRVQAAKSQQPIRIDGQLTDAGWSGAGRADNFVERHPGDKTRPEVETQAYITFDDRNLYVAFVCLDDPAAIRATMCQRDQFSGDDAVCVLLDTYGDASWAYEFFVNPHGVQKDMLWSSVAGEDMGFDLIWESAAKITDSGYQVEMSIPFASLRFPNNDVQSWKMDFWRNRPRESFKQYSWAAYDRDEQCWPCQWGTVDGISSVQPGKGIEALPTYLATRFDERNNVTDPTAGLNSGDVLGEFSLGAKYAVSSNLTMEATYNPDFSQIEGDAAQIDVNTTIALFYPERRPFFQEGSDIFRTLFNSFYTRTVNDPQFAAKLTGRYNGASVGGLFAYDENSPYMIPLEEGSILLNAGKSAVSVGRGRLSVGNDSQLGIMLSDRRFDGGGSGSILAGDADVRISRSLSLDGQWVLSHTKEQDNPVLSEGLEGFTFADGEHTVALDGESYYGTAFITRLRRHARAWNFIIDYNQVTDAYRTQTGFDPLANYRNASVYSGYNFYFDKGLFQRVTPQVYVLRKWNFDGERKNEVHNFSIESQLRFAQTYVQMSYYTGAERFRNQDFDNLWSIDFDLGMRPWNWLGVNAGIDRSRNYARFMMAKDNETSVYAGLTIKPIDRLIIEPNINFLRGTDAETGEEFFDGFITRTRVRFQASRKFSVRLVTQYDDFSQHWDVDPLLTYRVSSFSVVYLGSTLDYDKLTYTDYSDPERWKASSRQFFLKLQYLFQT
ncbi:MAG: carbohydrate binding family 9 domain-containing protein [candidate division Zixibacteria bacterium]|nr:carbohydrate binding family 9 domain-containing protein [candidate division Zixibacteria bacterium]